MTFCVRLLIPADLSAAAHLERLCFSRPWSESVLQSEFENGCLFWGAFAAGQLAGYVGLKIAADEGYVGNLAVSPDFRRRGVGQALMDALLAHAKSSGLAFVTLEARVSNTAARALYEKNGFSLMGIRPDFYSEPVEDAAIYKLERLTLFVDSRNRILL